MKFLQSVPIAVALALASLPACSRELEPSAVEGAAPGSAWTTASGRVPGVAERPVIPSFELPGFWVHAAESIGVQHSMGFRFQSNTYQRTTRGQVIESGGYDVVSQTDERWELLLMPDEESGGGEQTLVLRPTPDASGFSVAGARDVVYSRRADAEPELHNSPDGEGPETEEDQERPAGGTMRLGDPAEGSTEGSAVQ
jgi:hypothetical protein